MYWTHWSSNKYILILFWGKITFKTSTNNKILSKSLGKIYSSSSHNDDFPYNLFLKIINDQKEMPVVVYVSREKRANVPHRFKGGALNTLVCTHLIWSLNVPLNIL